MSPAQAATTKQIVQSVYKAFQRGDVAAILAAMSPDVVFVDQGPSVVPFFGAFRGQSEVAGFFQKLTGSLEFEEFVVEHIVAEGDRAVSLGHFRARSRANGRTMTSHFAHSWLVHGGKIVEVRPHLDTDAMASLFR
jgi:ketosteroid isomerase-like protein